MAFRENVSKLLEATDEDVALIDEEAAVAVAYDPGLNAWRVIVLNSEGTEVQRSSPRVIAKFLAENGFNKTVAERKNKSEGAPGS